MANLCHDAQQAYASEHKATDNVEVDDRWWVKQGLWALETCNGNSWDLLSSAMLARSKADILFGQETKTYSSAAIRKAEREAGKLGWNPVCTKSACKSLGFYGP